MSDDDLKVYKEGRPYIRAVLALLFYLRYGPRDEKFEVLFTRADDFLTVFEQRRS